MKVKFTGPVAINGVDYKPGTHDVPDLLAKHWYFLALLNKGTAIVVEAGRTKVNKSAPTTPPLAMKKPDDAPTPVVETKGNGDLPADAEIDTPDFDADDEGSFDAETGEAMDDEELEGTGDGTEEGDDEESFDETGDDEENFDETDEPTEEEEEAAPTKKAKKKTKKKAKKKK